MEKQNKSSLFHIWLLLQPNMFAVSCKQRAKYPFAFLFDCLPYQLLHWRLVWKMNILKWVETYQFKILWFYFFVLINCGASEWLTVAADFTHQVAVVGVLISWWAKCSSSPTCFSHTCWYREPSLTLRPATFPPLELQTGTLITAASLPVQKKVWVLATKQCSYRKYKCCACVHLSDINGAFI